MEKINVLAVQMESVIGDKFKNYEKILALTEKTIDSGTDVLILPELWTVGWACDEFVNSAEPLLGDTIEFLSELAQKNNVNILGGSFVQSLDGKYFNTCPVINRKGELIATYNKNHLFSYYDDCENKYITDKYKTIKPSTKLINIDPIEAIPLLYNICVKYIIDLFKLEKVNFNLLKGIGICKIFKLGIFTKAQYLLYFSRLVI